MSDIAKLGFSVDTKDLAKGEKALDSFAKTGEKTERRTKKSSGKVKESYEQIESAVGKTAAEVVRAERSMARAQKESTKQLAKRSRGFGQAGIQVQQFIGQVQGGQGVMLAFSQQSADLGIVLGAPLLGAVAGISASLVGLLIPNLIDTTTSMQDLDKAMEAVNKTATDTDGIKAFTREIAQLAKESEKSARLIILAAEQSSREAGAAAAEGMAEEFNDAFDVTLFQGSFDALVKIAGTSASKASISIAQDYIELGEQFGLTGIEAQIAGETILVSLREMQLAVSAGVPDAGEKIIAFQENLASLAETSSGKNRKKLLTFVNSISEYVQKAKLAAEMTKLFNDTLKNSDLDIPTEETKKLTDATDSISISLRAQIIALRDGEEAAIRFGIAQRLGLDDTKNIPLAIQEQINALIRLKEAKKAATQADRDAKKLEADRKKELSDFEKLTNQVENFGGAWSRTGSVIVDAFGNISDSINDYMSQLSDLDNQQSKINANREKEGADLVALNKLEQKVTDNRTLAELRGLGALSKAGGSLFKEKTAASKAFAALSKVIAIAEIALSFQKIAAGTAETGIHVANETTKQGANALTAITSAFAAPFPIGFVAGAAMIAVMASLLGGSSGGGGSGFDSSQAAQEAQGTGTVFGSDEKSQSIINAQERFEDIAIDQLAELRGIRNSMTALADGIARLAGSIVGGGLGDFEGQIGKTQAGSALGGFLIEPSSIIDKLLPGGLIGKALNSFFGSTKKTIIDEGVSFIAQSLGSIIDDGVISAQAFFDIKTKKKKFFGLSSKTSTGTEFQDIDDEIGSEIGAIFSNIGNAVSQSVSLLGLDTNKSVDDFVISIGRISFKDLTGEEIQAELEAVFSQQADLLSKFLVPELANFQQIGEGLFDTLLRVAQEQAIFNDAIEVMGGSLSELSSIVQIEVAQSIIGLIGSLERFSDLTNEFFEEFFTEEEQFERLSSSLNEAISGLGVSMFQSRGQFRFFIESIDKATLAGQKLFAGMLELVPAFDSFFDSLESGLESQIAAENRLRQQAFNDESRLIKKAISDSKAALSTSFKSEIQIIRDNAAIRIDALNDEKSALDATSASMRSLVDSINNSLGLAGGQNLATALASARLGEFGQAQALDIAGLANLDPSGFASAESLAIQQAINLNRLAEISGLAGAEASKAETAAEAIERQITETKAIADKQVDQLNDQLNALLGIDNSVLSIADAIIDFNEAVAAVPSAVVEVVAATEESINDENQELLSSILDQLEESNVIQLETLRKATTSASALQQFKLDGMDIRQIE